MNTCRHTYTICICIRKKFFNVHLYIVERQGRGLFYTRVIFLCFINFLRAYLFIHIQEI